ncbi:MAG TPA: hypothetical protein DCY97_17350 [Marinilabiliales bacterium]|nr:hypothetical protein [Marinilabiliales bacterium]
MKKIQIASTTVILSALIGTGIYYYFLNKSIKQNPIETKVAHLECLGDDEVADFPINEYYSNEYFKYPKFPVVIYVKDKKTNKEKFHFQIDNVFENYRPIEIYKCGIYVIREFNYNPKIRKQKPGYSVELWKYNYGQSAKKLLTLSETNPQGLFVGNYSYDFRIDPQEIYVSLEYSYSGKEDYALVIKNFNNNTDDFVLSRQSLSEKHPEFLGYFGLSVWTKNGSYFWARLFAGAYTEAFLRIARDSWNVDVFPVPDGVLGGTALNVDKGYVTQLPGHVWTGIDVVTEEIKKELIKQGKISQLYLFNLLSRNRILLATTTEPLWNFKPHWFSDNQLQYEMPSGEKKIYIINEK